MRDATTSNANPMIDDRLRRGVDVSWTCDRRRRESGVSRASATASDGITFGCRFAAAHVV